MNERDVLKKINSLKEFKPASEWKATAREDLFLRISNSSQSVKISLWQNIVFETKHVYSYLTQPVFATLGLFALVFASVLGVNATKTTKPGDSFYAARVLSEKARVAVTMDKQAKAKLEMKYASVRAKEITEVLSKQSAQDDKSKRLTEDLKAEIKTVVAKYDEINNSVVEGETVARGNGNTASSVEDDNVAIGIGRPVAEESQEVFAAGSQKATSGIQISQNNVASSVSSKISTSSADSSVVEPATPSSDNDLKKNLSQAVASVETNDYQAAKNILEQIDMDKIIDSIDQSNKKTEVSATTSVTEMIDRGTISSTSKNE